MNLLILPAVWGRESWRQYRLKFLEGSSKSKYKKSLKVIKAYQNSFLLIKSKSRSSTFDPSQGTIYYFREKVRVKIK